MTKKEYILNLSNLIINRVKFHSPKNVKEVDFTLLEVVGIDAGFPIFIFPRSLNKIYYKAFLQAKKDCQFNLILIEKPCISKRKLEKLTKTFYIKKEEIGSNLSATLDSLNINYLTRTNFKLTNNYEFLKINNKEVNFNYIPFCYAKKLLENGITIDIKSFILNGKNYNLSFTNTHSFQESVEFEFNIPLPRGYYSFKRHKNHIEILNLTNKERAYFNFNFEGGEISYSTMSGIESCTFACVNVRGKITLLPKENKKISFNFGQQRYVLKNPFEMEYFYLLSQNKMKQIFDTKVSTRDKIFDDNYNEILPKKIWESWYNFSTDEESENLYLKNKNMIFRFTEKGVNVSKDFKGLKEVKFFRNNSWKRVFIVHNKLEYLLADKIKYYNFTLLTKEIFDKNNEIYLSFAQ